MSELEDNVLIPLIQQISCSSNLRSRRNHQPLVWCHTQRLQRFTLCLPSRILRSRISLLLPLHLLQPEELLTIHLVQFADNVLDRVVKLWDNDVLDGVNAPVCLSDNFVEDREGSLERGEFDEGFDGFGVDFFRTEDLLAPSTEAGEVEVFRTASESEVLARTVVAYRFLLPGPLRRPATLHQIRSPALRVL